MPPEPTAADPVRVAVASHCRLGEGPLWSANEGALYWVDVPRPSSLHRWQPEAGTHETYAMPEMVLAVADCTDGGLLIASDRTLNLFDRASQTLTPLHEPEPDLPGNRINDGGTDAAGRFWFGTLQNNFAADNSDIPITQRVGSLYSYDHRDGLRVHDHGIGAANTIAFSPDNRFLYFADTVAGWIYRYDFDLAAGEIGNRVDFAHNPELGRPDGSAVDADGYLWNCRLGAGCVIRYAPDGTIARVVALPTRMVTSCAFGGTGLETLFITTARFYLTAAELADQPHAGCIFAADVGVSGLPQGPFAVDIG